MAIMASALSVPSKSVMVRAKLSGLSFLVCGGDSPEVFFKELTVNPISHKPTAEVFFKA